MNMKMCPNPNCAFDKPVTEGDYCPECGTAIRDVKFMQTGKIINYKKSIKNGTMPPLSPEESKRYIYGETKEEKAQRKKEEKENKIQKNQLFNQEMSDDELTNKIYGDMANLAMQEAGTKWMKAGAMLSFNPTNQMVASGLKALIDQNKLIIRQNEQVLRELKKLNQRHSE
jgi:hypothetical protein